MLSEDLVNFAKYAIKVYGLKIPENHPLSWDEVLNRYKKDKYTIRPGMLWLNHTVANFFEQDPEDLRNLPRFPKYRPSYVRQVSMFFMRKYNYRTTDIAKFYKCTKPCVSRSEKQIENVLMYGKFDLKKNLQILKYELL